jgi:hypothetical protein
MDERTRVAERILDEGGRLMDERRYTQARDAYLKMENSVATEAYKETARKFARQAQDLLNSR